MKDYDFSGYATKNDLLCADGRVIRHDAFKDNDGKTVPLVWQHVHDNPMNVLGHALLENRDDGVYAYGTFNNTEAGQHAKEMVENGDIVSMSIFANHLKQNGSDVIHGLIREVSLVLAGANPGALIDNVSLAHDDGSYSEVDDAATIYSGIEDIHYLNHADQNDKKEEEDSVAKNDEKGSEKTVADIFNTLNDEQKEAVYFLIGKAMEGDLEDDDSEEMQQSDEIDYDNDLIHADNSEKTVQDVFDTFNEDQKNVVYFLIGQAIEQATDDVKHSYDGGNSMKHNVFDESYNNDVDVLTHDEFAAIMADAGKASSLKEVFIQHGIENLDILFPEAQMVRPQPDMISRPQGWVDRLWNAVHRSPFARIKSAAANITADAARAKGYVKGNQKVDEVITMLSRETNPQTIYKKQTLDRDDVIDITNIDVIAWLKAEMRLMLNEELCHAILVGDGREPNTRDKINEERIRPIYTDSDVYTIHYQVTYTDGMTDDQKASAIIDSAIRSRKDYKGSGNPMMFATNETITDMLLAKDTIGRRLYKDENELKAALRVQDIIEVPIMEGITRTKNDKTYNLLALIVNPKDYTIGADKGGAVSLFDDFDIDYNQMKYLIETRCSGALTLPYSAIALEVDSDLVNP